MDLRELKYKLAFQLVCSYVGYPDDYGLGTWEEMYDNAGRLYDAYSGEEMTDDVWYIQLAAEYELMTIGNALDQVMDTVEMVMTETVRHIAQSMGVDVHGLTSGGEE